MLERYLTKALHSKISSTKSNSKQQGSLVARYLHVVQIDML
jgi:hypothetical protein